MITATEKDLISRYKNLSPRLKNAIDSPSTFNLIKNISRTHSLSDEDAEITAAYAAYVLLGVLEPKNLFDELKIYIPTSEKTTAEIVREINFQVFFPLHDDLEKLYKLETHIEEDLEKETTESVIRVKTDEKKPEAGARISLEKLGEEKPFDAAQGRPATVKVGVEEKPKEGEPLIIHKETEQEPVVEEKKFKGFGFPFTFFRPKEGESSVKAKVEIPGKKPKKEKRVVHYSEYRTPLTPFGKPEEEIINLETFTKREPPPQTPPNKESPEPPKEGLKTEPELKPETKSKPRIDPKTELPKPEKDKLNKENGKGPSIKGNIIDLKNN